jgi:hypothetical protein
MLYTIAAIAALYIFCRFILFIARSIFRSVAR